MKISLLIDGDVLAYRAAAVAEKREVQIIHKPSGLVKVFKNKTEFKNFLKEKDFPYVEEDYEIREIQFSLGAALATDIINKQIERLKTELFANEVIIYVSGEQNFRDYLPLPDKYKGNRADLQRPLHLKDCKDYLVKSHGALESQGIESDDHMIIAGYERKAAGYKPILVTVDKDANAYTGLCTYDFTQEKPEVVPLPAFGSLWDTGKKITGNGFIWLCYQWVFGDPVDYYKPCTLNGAKYGEKSAFNYLKDCTNEKEALEKVVAQYKIWYPGIVEYTAWDGTEIVADYKYLLDLYFKCCKMKETIDDDLDAEAFLTKYGVTL